MTLHKRTGSRYRRATLADVRRWLAPQGYEVVKMTRDGGAAAEIAELRALVERLRAGGRP